MIKATLNPQDMAKLAENPELYVQAIVRKVQRFVLLLQQKIKREKLQGQVLAHRSGRLDRSIIALPVVAEGPVVSGEVQGAGPPAGYGVFHEKGGTHSYIIEPKSKKALMFIAQGGAKAFARKVNHPAIKMRSFMRSSLEEMQSEIIAGLQETSV